MTGTQVGMTDKQKVMLEMFLRALEITQGHHGDCVGADADFHRIIRKIDPDIDLVTHPPINTSKRAYMKADREMPADEYIKRNHNIVNAVDVMVATPRTAEEELRSGTWATIRYAEKIGRKIYVFGPDGALLLRPNKLSGMWVK